MGLNILEAVEEYHVDVEEDVEENQRKKENPVDKVAKITEAEENVSKND